MSERLSDQIIDSGPFLRGQSVPVDLLDAGRVNELREELIRLRGPLPVMTKREERLIKTLEAVIRRTVPERPGPGYFLATYMIGPMEGIGIPLWAVCPHGHVCLMTSRGWRHLEPHRPAWCDGRPSMTFSVVL